MKRLFLILLCVVAASVATNCAYAQKRKVQNRPYIDQRRFHYGFLAGMHFQDIEIQNNGYKDEQGNEWYVDNPNYEPGFSVGILGEMRLNKHLALRLIPTMHFGTKNMVFKNNLDGEKRHLTLKSTYISVPVDLKFSAERFNNYRPYAMIGVNAMVDLTVKKQRELLLKPFDLYLEVGLGCDFYTPFFKCIPELKFCFGLLDIIDKNRSDVTDPEQLIFTQSVKGGRSKMFVLTLYFE